MLLRGINVSGKNKLPMQDLREMLNAMNYQNVQTYIQSGNIILETEKERRSVEKEIKEAIQHQFGYEVPVIAKTVEDVKRAIQDNPYPIENEKIVAVVFLSDVSTRINLEINKADDDEFTILNDVVYLYCPNGFGRSKLTINVFEKKLILKKIGQKKAKQRKTLALFACFLKN